jgi:hypothetical protein
MKTCGDERPQAVRSLLLSDNFQRGYLERASTQKAKGDKRKSEQLVVVAHFFALMTFAGQIIMNRNRSSCTQVSFHGISDLLSPIPSQMHYLCARYKATPV